MSGRHRRVRRLHGDGRSAWLTDELTPEEPLEIRLDGRPLAVTMRTPGDDFDLAVGFLVTEGVIGGADEIAGMRMCPHAAESAERYNVVEVSLRRPAETNVATRNFYMSSSCGICGKASIDAVRTRSRHDVREDRLRLSAAQLTALPGALRAAQTVFAHTGGLHAAGLFDADGTLISLREDVGRHNAFDKVIGWAATQRRLPLRSHIVLASGRASFELTQKALMAGIPMIAAVSAPSDLAVQLADEAGMTLIGFLRGDQMNVYTGHHRVLSGAGELEAGPVSTSTPGGQRDPVGRAHPPASQA